MKIFGSMIYGLLTGLSEFLPVSASAHQFLFEFLTGFSAPSHFLSLMVYLGCMGAVAAACWKRLAHIHRELRLSALPKKRRKRLPDMLAVSDFRLIMTAAIPVILSLFFRTKAQQTFGRLTWLILTLSITGVLLYLPQFMRVGNKDSRSLRPLDALILGLCCGLSVIPGLSSVAILCYLIRARRCGREYSYELLLLLAIPALLGLVIFHLLGLLSAGVGVDRALAIAGLLGALAAFGGGIAGIRLMRYLAVKLDFHGFAHYCWGMAVFCFIYYLMT